MLITAMVLSGGAILTDSTGSRFCNETGDPFDTSKSVVETQEPFVFEIFDQNVADNVYKVSVYQNMGIVEQADTVEELAEKVGLPADTLKATIEQYNAAVESGKDEFGRTIFTQPLTTAPFYCVKVAAGGVMTFGGLTLDDQCRVLKEDGTVIEGLYSAGEATGRLSGLRLCLRRRQRACCGNRKSRRRICRRVCCSINCVFALPIL